MDRLYARLPAWWPRGELEKPPEGGWGWVVVAASFLAHIIVLGSQYSFGVVSRALLLDEEFSAGNRAATSTVGSLAVATMLGAGTLTGALVRRSGHRRVAIAGVALTSGGFILSSLAPNITFLTFSYGLVAGLGQSFSFAPSVMLLSRYFVKRRALATGLAVSGSGVGTFLMGFIAQALIEAVGWRATLRVVGIFAGAGLLLAASTYVPVRFDPHAHAHSAAHGQGHGGSSASSSASAAAGAGAAVAGSSSVGASASGGSGGTAAQGAGLLEAGPADASRQWAPIAGAPLAAAAHPSDSEPRDAAAIAIRDGQPAAPGAPGSGSGSSSSGILSRSGSGKAEDDGPPREALSLLQVWRHRAFLPMAAVLAIYGGSLFTVYGHIVLSAQDSTGMDAGESARLVSVLGLGGMTGRVVMGYLTDKVNKIAALATCLAIAGSSVLLLPLFAAFPAYWFLLAFVFGFFSGGTVSQVPPIMVDALGLQNLPHSQGGCYTVQAPLVLAGPALAGLMRATLGSYTLVWLAAGAAMTLSPLLLRLMPERTRRRQRTHSAAAAHVPAGSPAAAAGDSAGGSAAWTGSSSSGGSRASAGGPSGKGGNTGEAMDAGAAISIGAAVAALAGGSAGPTPGASDGGRPLGSLSVPSTSSPSAAAGGASPHPARSPADVEWD